MVCTRGTHDRQSRLLGCRSVASCSNTTRCNTLQAFNEARGADRHGNVYAPKFSRDRMDTHQGLIPSSLPSLAICGIRPFALEHWNSFPPVC